MIEDRLAILVIAYYNLAVELEHLHRYDEALKSYKDAVSYSTKYLGPESDVT